MELTFGVGAGEVGRGGLGRRHRKFPRELVELLLTLLNVSLQDGQLPQGVLTKLRDRPDAPGISCGLQRLRPRRGIQG